MAEQLDTESAPADFFKEAQPGVVDELLKDKSKAREAFIAAEKTVGMDGVVDPKAVLNQTVAAKVPEQFKTPTGEVDAEKLKTSTQQLDEAIAKKEEAIQAIDPTKSVDELVRHYQESYKKFRAMPNVDKMAQAMTPARAEAPALVPVEQMSGQQLIDLINQDIQKNPGLTMVNLIDLALERKRQEWIQPLQDERRQNGVRQNIEELAKSDSRVLDPQLFKAITEKLDANPEFWNLRNPHKAAWLEVKEERRLGEPTKAQVPPSRPAAPILGGGTPPPPQSAGAGPITPDSVLSAIQQANMRDPAQKQNVAAVLRDLVDRDFRARK